MEIDRRECQELVSDCRSFGSGHLSNQSRKISIGIMADSLVKARSKTTRDNEAAMPTAKKVTSSNVNSKDDGNSGKGAEAVIIGKQTEGTAQESSPWVYSRSFHQKESTSEAVHCAEVTANLQDANGTCNGLNGVDAAPTTCSVHYGVSVLQSGDGKQKKFDKVSYRRMGGKDGTKETVEEFSFATAMEILPENEVVEGKINRTENRREALRVKLWEILGTVSSPSKQVSQGLNRGVNVSSPDKQVSQGHAMGVNVSSLDKNVLQGPDRGVNVSSPDKQASEGHDMGVNVSSLDKKVLQALDVGVSNLNPEQSIINKRKRVIKPRQESDTIESDSENPGHPIKRPVTRSLSRKGAQSKMQITRTRNVKYSEKNIFSFQKGFSGKQEAAVVGGTSKSIGTKRDRKSFTSDEHEMYIPVKDDADEIQQATNKSRSRTKQADKKSSHGNRIGSFCRCPTENNSEFVEPEIGIQRKGSLTLPAKNMTDQPGSIKNSTFPDHRAQLEDFANSSVKDIAEPHSGFQSPTFEIRTPTKSFSPGSPHKTHHGEHEDNDSPTFRSFNSLLASKPDEGMESYADAEEAEDSPLMRSEPIMEDRDAENGLSKSSSDPESSKDGSPINEGSETESLTQEIGSTGKAKGVLYPSKRLRRQEDINGFSPISASPKGTEQSPEDENQKDGLAKAIGLLGLALERVKSKIKSVADEKSAKALVSVAEGIHLQLQNAESQIQRDVGKLTRLGKSKRKHLETEFEEQQEHLKIIYQKFKEEVDLHLKECRSTFEGLEAQEIEFRGIVEKHRTSQRKLLKQVEDAIETKLDEAQRRITVIHKLARGKMLQLKYVLMECLKEGILS